ncbi:MAG: sigma-70 family RNA polymerase sigma factor [Tepidisphaerales bacterium]
MKPSPEEFEKLALEHIDMVDRVARTLTHNPAEADDLVQETYLRALQARESFDLRSFGMRPWLLRILHNIHITRSTREARQPKAVEAEQLQAYAGPDDAPAVSWQPSEELDKALDRLPVELRTALTLWAVEELSYQEIAEVVGVPIGTVMSRLHRARQRLRQDLHAIAARGHVSGNRR